MSSLYRHFGNMTWPVPGERLNEIHRALVYGNPTKSELLECVSVISAFNELVALPAVERNAIIRELRKGPALSSETNAAKGEE